MRKYTLQDNYFESIENEIQAYWLGYILADGYVQTRVSKDSRHYGLSISSIDKDIVETLKEDLQYTGVITSPKRPSGFINGKPCYRLCISSMKLSQDLLRYKPKGISITMPDIAEHLRRHFIRGFFDGDGSIYSWISNETHHTNDKTYHYKRFMLEASIIGPNSILTPIELELDKHNIKTRYKPSKTTYLRYLVVSNKPDLHRFRDYLYFNASRFLKRKYDKWYTTPPEWETIQRKPRICGKPVIQA